MSSKIQPQGEKFIVILDGEEYELEDKVLHNGQRLSDTFMSSIAGIEFSRFENNLRNKNYEAVYSSDVFEAITALYNENNIMYVDVGTKVLRARVIKDAIDIYQEQKGIHFDGDALRGYDWYNSKEPAVGLSSEGRANSRYSSYFYCANDGATAASEIKPNIGDYISLASFIVKRKLKLIELKEKEWFPGKTQKDCYFDIIANHFSIPVSDSSEYFLTQFISDELRKFGIDGICYKSHFTHERNYVIFNCSMDTIEFCKSKIIQLHSQQLNFIDFSGNNMISTKAIPKLNEDEIIEKKNYIFGVIESYKEHKNGTTSDEGESK